MRVSCGKVVGNLLRFENLKARVGETQLSDFYLVDDGIDVAWRAGTIADEFGGIKSGDNAQEGPANLLDGDSKTKFYRSRLTGVIIHSPELLSFNEYAFTTGGDMPSRDPVSWSLSVGTIAGAETNWIEIAREENRNDEVPMARRVRIKPAFSARLHNGGIALPENYEIRVAEDAKLILVNLKSGLSDTRKIAGAGTVELRGSLLGDVYAGDAFSGQLNVVGSITNHASRVESSGGTVCLLGTENAYSGETKIGSDGTFATRKSSEARYFKLTVTRNSCDADTAQWHQISELELLRNNEKVPWPEGRVARKTDDDSVCEKLIDGQKNTKVEWNKEGSFLIVESPSVIAFDGYRLCAANDCIYGNGIQIRNGSFCRHPISWRFEYSLDGEHWTVFDDQKNNWRLDRGDGTPVLDITTVTNHLVQFSIKAQDEEDPDTAIAVVNEELQRIFKDYYNQTFYTYRSGSRGILSENSAVVVAGGRFVVDTVFEEIPSLTGHGTVTLLDDSALVVKTAEEGAFDGSIAGGRFVKAGDGVQTLKGTVACKELVVEAGELVLDGVDLTGVTNIVLKGGVLSGTATMDGDLKVTSAGGAYDASIALADALTLVNAEDHVFTIRSGLQNEPIAKTLFSFGSADSATREIFEQAKLREDISGNWSFRARAAGTAFSFSVSRVATVIMIR